MAVQAAPYVPGRGRGPLQRGPGSGPEPAIVVVAPAELGALSRARPPAGVLVVGGAPLAHPMLRLFALGCPVAIVTPRQAGALPLGDSVSLDGGTGLVSREPFAGGDSAPAPAQPGRSGRLADGSAVALRASVGDAEGARRARDRGAEAIGLVRSEYLFPADGRAPDRAYYRRALGAIAEAAAPLAMTVRLPDLSVDKPVPWLGPVPGFAGPLGRHGSRLFDVEPVASAVRAEAGAVGELGAERAGGLIVPFLAEVAELVRWRDALRPLLPAGVAVGAMLETPAAGREIGAFLAAADFAAIGCNDLMQTLFAADRDIPEVAALLDPYSPVMLRLLADMAAQAGSGREQVTLCGLLPQLPGLLPVLLGLGFRTFSVEPLLIPHLAAVAAATEPAAAEGWAAAACAARTAAEVREALGLPARAPWAPEAAW
jgi:phosphoenolpyruvate-protein kinase (PTS system EI component)